MGMLAGLQRRAAALGAELHALYLAARDPRTPLVAKLVAGAVAAYALSPIDLVPDVIPVLGYLDDIVLLPLGVLLARRLVPAPVLDDCRRRAAAAGALPVSRTGMVAVVLAWVLIFVASAIALRAWLAG
jgi:uncharacterized membrane protein YkvA (DUF1232 family)